MAETLAREAARIYSKLEYQTEFPLGVREVEIEVGVRKPTDAEVKEAEQKLSTAERPLKGLPLIYARETTLLAKFPDTVKVKVQVMRIGSLAIASCPFETFTETGLAIKKGSPFAKTFTISLANGYNGYLPPPDEHQRGGYETWRARSSYVATDAEPKVRQSILQLLSDLNKGLEGQ